MSAFDDLLVVQDHDTRIDQLRHRRDTLPERARLVEIGEQVAGLDREAAEASVARDELAQEQKLHEDEVASLGDRKMSAQAKLYGGEVGNPRELQALQEEINALGRRVDHLEDRTIELMEQIEPLDAELAQAAATRADLDQRGGGLRAQIAEEEVAIEGELERVRSERATLAATVEPELLAEYDTLRPQSGGIAIARLVGGSCGGCHLGLSAVEVDRIKKLPPEAPAHCEECGRLLAR